MLLKCPECGTHYDVEDELFADPTVQVQCESCEIVLVPVLQEGKIKDEKTAMLAAFEPDELEKILGQTRLPAGPVGRAAVQRRTAAGAAPPAPEPAPPPFAPPAPPSFAPAPAPPSFAPPAPPGHIPPPTQKLEAYIPPQIEGLAATQAVPPYVPPGSAEAAPAWPPPSSPKGGRQRGAADGPAQRRGGGGAERRMGEDPLSAIAGASSAAEVLDPGERDELGATCRPPELDSPPGPPCPEARRQPAGAGVEPAGESPRPVPRPVRVTPIALLVLAPLLLAGSIVGSMLLVRSLLASDEASKPQAQAKPLSYKASLALLLRRNQGSYPTTKLGEGPDQALPLFVHEDGILVRSAQALPLEGGHVPKSKLKGLLIKDLASRLAQEIAPAKVAGAISTKEGAGERSGPEAAAEPPLLGKGQKSLLLVVESGLPFATVGRILFTAQSVGYRSFFFAGTPTNAPDTLRGLKLEKLSWYRVAPGAGGRGLGLQADSEGYLLFDRSGGSLPQDEAAPESKDRIRITRSSSALAELVSAIRTANADSRFREITVSPSPGLTYEQLLVLLESIAGGEDEQPLFGEVVLAAGDI